MLGSAAFHGGAGNWAGALSEISWGSTDAGHSGPRKTRCDLINECEPELVRFTSLESEADTEVFMRLFGRKTSVTSRFRAVPEQEPSCPAFPLSSFPATPSKIAVPALVNGQDSPPSPQASESHALSPRGSLGSEAGDVYGLFDARACDGNDVEVLVHSDSAREASYVPQWRSCEPASTAACNAEHLPRSTPEGRPGEDPTCSVDAFAWTTQSLESILTTQPSLSSCSGVDQSDLTPEDVLRSSLLELISDPDVKAKIMSLQLFTTVQPSVASAPPADEAAACMSAGAEDEECHVTRTCADAESVETLESPSSPPALRRRFTARRDSVVEDCWLTGEQLRRKYSALEEFGAGQDPGELKRKRC